MQKLSNKEEINKSPFCGLNTKKASEFETLFLEDYSSFSTLYERIQRARSKILKTTRISEKAFIKLENNADDFNSKLNLFAIGDYSVSEIFLDEKEGFETLKSFIMLRLKANTIWSEYQKMLDRQER